MWDKEYAILRPQESSSPEAPIPKGVVLALKINALATFSRRAKDMHCEPGFGQFGHHSAAALLIAGFDH